MREVHIVLICGLMLIVGLIISDAYMYREVTDRSLGTAEVRLVYATSGIMPQLLNTSQVDSFFVWEPVVSTAVMGNIGSEIATEADIPPVGKWTDSACTILVMRNDFIMKYPEIAAYLSAVTMAGIQQIHTDPDDAQNITASWVFGSQPIRSAGVFLDPEDVEEHSFKNLNFTDTAPFPGITAMSSMEQGQAVSGTDPSEFLDESVAMRAKELLNGSEPEFPAEVPTVRIGYLPSSDQPAPLYVAIKDPDTMYATYGFCLKPPGPVSGHPGRCDLVVDNRTIAHVTLLPGQVGGGIMTGLGQNAMDAAYIGSVPAEMQISMGNNASGIQSVCAGGSGLIVRNDAPCTDWDSFVSWIKERSEEHKPVIIAVPQSSIQEEIIREAFAYENIQITLYGLSPHDLIQDIP
ncbi:MAG: ABC transporter substrate-binding protein [Methanospirillum sp.]|nr:ABC transporter substrate-binding protein [Methanospirillum sp.]